MRQLPEFYKQLVKNKFGLSEKKELFDYLITNLSDSIFTWEYFVEWDKILSNVNNIEVELKILSSLIGKDNIEDNFIALIKEYPKTRAALPILIAVRNNKLKDCPVISDAEELEAEIKTKYFNPSISITAPIEKELLIFFTDSGLKEIFQNRKIKDLVDYCTGVEVGMDTNARKNRTGTLAEELLEKHLKSICKEFGLDFVSQATKKTIKDKWNYDISLDKANRAFDFAMYIPGKKLFLFEVNYYSGGGSKLKATAGEYAMLGEFLNGQKIEFIWVTDGLGWNTSRRPLEETFMKLDYVMNFSMVRSKILRDIISHYLSND